MDTKIKDVCDMTEEEMIAEIERLRKSPYVKLAKSVANKKMQQKIYQLRSLERKGMVLAEALEGHDG